MAKLVEDPILKAQFATESRRRVSKVLIKDQSRLSSHEQLLLEICFNNAVSGDSVIDSIHKQVLFEACEYQYHIVPDVLNGVFSHRVIVVHDPVLMTLTVFIEDYEHGELTQQRYYLPGHDPLEIFIDETLSPEEFTSGIPAEAINDGMALIAEAQPVERLLFFIACFEEVRLTATEKNVDTMRLALTRYLNRRLLTLYLNNNRHVQLYGHLDEHDFIHLSLKVNAVSISYLKRIVQLPLVLGQISE